MGGLRSVALVALVVSCIVVGALCEEQKKIPHRGGRRSNGHRSPDYRAHRHVDEKLHNYPGNFGVDMALWTSPSEDLWKCMRTKGNYTFASVECWDGGMGIRKDIKAITSAAWDAGFHQVDLYAFMCPQCSCSPDSVKALVDEAHSQGARYNRIWLDIEQCDGCWYTDLSENARWIMTLVAEYVKLNVPIGIYSSVYEWGAVTGGATDFKDLPIWYANYDGVPSFADWQDFGGWTKPYAKQFDDKAGNACGVSVDRDWYP